MFSELDVHVRSLHNFPILGELLPKNRPPLLRAYFFLYFALFMPATDFSIRVAIGYQTALYSPSRTPKSFQGVKGLEHPTRSPVILPLTAIPMEVIMTTVSIEYCAV